MESQRNLRHLTQLWWTDDNAYHKTFLLIKTALRAKETIALLFSLLLQIEVFYLDYVKRQQF